jgi:hypothetical protein
MPVMLTLFEEELRRSSIKIALWKCNSDLDSITLIGSNDNATYNFNVEPNDLQKDPSMDPDTIHIIWEENHFNLARPKAYVRMQAALMHEELVPIIANMSFLYNKIRLVKIPEYPW